MLVHWGCKRSRGYQKSFDQLAGKIGGIDILVCNAAGNFICPTEDLSWNGWRTVIETDLNGTLTRLRSLTQRIDGRWTHHFDKHNTSGLWLAGCCSCSGSKSGIQNLMKTLAAEWGQYNIRSNWISPGPIQGTEGVDRLIIQQGLADQV